MTINEFTDAYSDDQIYLEMIAELVAAHPIEGLAPERIRYSSFARLWATMMVGAIESMIKVWNRGDPLWADIAAYLEVQPNTERLENLRLAFAVRGLTVDTEMLRDFLAIKYIRNAYIHSAWKNDQREYVLERGFPGDVTSFTPAHFNRMQDVYRHLLNNLGRATLLVGIIRSL